MKIAFVADDEQTISSHFGRATAVVVVTVEDGQEVAREIREKEGHGEGHDHGDGHVHIAGLEQDHDHHHDGDGHGEGHGHHGSHASKFTSMQDCQVLVARGMGSPAVTHAENMGLDVYLTRERTIDTALSAYLEGTLDHDERRVHHH